MWGIFREKNILENTCVQFEQDYTISLSLAIQVLQTRAWNTVLLEKLEAYSHSDSHKTPAFLWNPTVHCR